MARTFQHSLRVPYADIDKMGIVYYANYFVYFEMARAQMLRDAGIPYGELEARGVMLPVVHAECDYKKPAHYDDLLVVNSEVRIDGSRLRVDYVINREDEIIATGMSEHVCMSDEGRIMKPVDEIREMVDG
ncbi:hypothetical protein BVX97_03130 [bacterium E08(2017)]|nr:hypothetical protein BVX97_03130 [bacterium E08(2017)]